MRNLFTTSPGQEGVPAISSKAKPLMALRQLYIHIFSFVMLDTTQVISEIRACLSCYPYCFSVCISLSLSLSLKFLHLPLLSGVAGYPQEDWDSYLLGHSSDRNLNDYLVELFDERLFTIHMLN